MEMFKSKTSLSVWLLCMAAAALILSWPFFSTASWETLDTIFHLNRIEGIKESLAVGDLPMRINGFTFNGYGTPIGIMYPDLLLYFPAVLRLFDIPIGLSYNLFWIFTVWLGLAMVWRGFTLWNGDVAAGGVAALLYGSSFVMMIHYGMSPGDYPAMCSLPLVFGSLKAVFSRNTRYWVEYAAAFTVAAESHVLTTLVICLVSLFFLLYYHRKLRTDKQIRSAAAKAALFCLLLNVWRYVPLAYFYHTINFQIFAAPWSHSLAEVTSNWPSLVKSQFFIGYHIVLLVIFFVWHKTTRRNVGWWVSVCFLALLTSMLWQAFPWRQVEALFPDEFFLARTFQYPLRFLIFGLVFVCCYLGRFVLTVMGKYAVAIGIFSALYGVFCAMCCPWYFFGNEPQTQGLGVKRIYESIPSYGIQEDYLYADVGFSNLRNDKGEVLGPTDFKSEATLFDTHKRATRLTFSYTSDKDTLVTLPLIYWPGYKATSELTDSDLPLTEDGRHIMQVVVPPGTDKVNVRYTGLWWFRVFDIISFLSLSVFIFLSVSIFLPKERRRS